MRFFNIHSVAKHQKNTGGPFGEIFFSKKVSQCQKNERGDPLVSPGMVCYAEKQEKPFWFSSLGQIVQFGAIIFCRTFKNYFCQFVWIEKSHYNSRVSLHEVPTKNLRSSDNFSEISRKNQQFSTNYEMKVPLEKEKSPFRDAIWHIYRQFFHLHRSVQEFNVELVLPKVINNEICDIKSEAI